jgi:hypothetical protein
VLAAALEPAATIIQWLKVLVVIGLPFTLTTALPGMPPPHATSVTPTSKTALSAAIGPFSLDTTRAL